AFGESPDLEKARAYLDASGADVNRPLEIIAQKAPHVSNAATIIQANLKELGIESNVDVRDLAGFYENLVTAEYDVILYQSPSSSSAGFSPDYVVGGLHSESPTNFGQCNDPKMD